MEGLSENKSIPLKNIGSNSKLILITTALYGAETWAITGKVENILRCDQMMLRYSWIEVAE